MERCKPEVRIYNYVIDGEEIVAAVAKATLSSKPIVEIMEGLGDSSVETWIREMIRRGHGSPLEHTVYGFEVVCSRVTSHQIVRHRIASYTQLSQRRGDKMLRNTVLSAAAYLGLEAPAKPRSRRDYGTYARVLGKLLGSTIGFEELVEITCNGFIVPPAILYSGDKEFLENLLRSLQKYYTLLSQGTSPEDARFILPQAVKTRLYITMNARELLESFLPLRMCMHAQWEIRYIAWSLWRQLVEIHPQIFVYAGPRCVLYENRTRRKPCTLEEYLSGRQDFTIERCPELVPREGIQTCLRQASMDPWLYKQFLPKEQAVTESTVPKVV